MDALASLVNHVYGLPCARIIEFLDQNTAWCSEEYIAVSCHIDIRRVRYHCRCLEKIAVVKHSRGTWYFEKKPAFDAVRRVLDQILVNIEQEVTSNTLIFGCNVCGGSRTLEDCMQFVMQGETPVCCGQEMFEESSGGETSTIIRELAAKLEINQSSSTTNASCDVSK